MMSLSQWHSVKNVPIGWVFCLSEPSSVKLIIKYIFVYVSTGKPRKDGPYLFHQCLLCHICSAQWLLSVLWHLKEELNWRASRNAICVLCCLTYQKENWQFNTDSLLDLSSGAERIQLFYLALRLPSKWMHLNGEATHTGVCGEGRETGKNHTQLKKENCICTRLSLWNDLRLPWTPFFFYYTHSNIC